MKTKQRVKFKIISAPIYPVRGTIVHSLDVDGCTLSDIITNARKLDGATDEVIMNSKITLDQHYDSSDVTLDIELPESDDVYIDRLRNYEKRLDAYQKWLDDNQDKIAEELEFQRKEKEARNSFDRGRLLRKKEAIEKQLKKLSC